MSEAPVACSAARAGDRADPLAGPWVGYGCGGRGGRRYRAGELASYDPVAGLISRNLVAGLTSHDPVAGLTSHDPVAGLISRNLVAGLISRNLVAGLTSHKSGGGASVPRCRLLATRCPIRRPPRAGESFQCGVVVAIRRNNDHNPTLERFNPTEGRGRGGGG